MKNAKYLFSNDYELEGDLKDWLNLVGPKMLQEILKAM